ncbi:sigma-70 family RNA polymerase sigma factor [soil metagenome]
MDGHTGSLTNASLLGRLRDIPTDQAAWREFVACYGKRIHQWCRQWQLQPADADNVTQTVLLKLVKAMRVFEYDPTRSFRAWLKTLAHHSWQDLATARRLQTVGGDLHLGEMLDSLEARDSLARQLEAAWDQELAELAMSSVRLRVLPITWESFRRTALDSQPAEDVAYELKIPLTSVYKAKSNVQKLLKEEIRRLEGMPPE